MAKNPVQPLVNVNGIIRFKQNEIVKFLFDTGLFDMNIIARMNFSDDDREQFAQLIGYSLAGFGDLSYVTDETYKRAISQEYPKE